MAKNVYWPAYKEYVKYCKEQNKKPYALRTLQNKVYQNNDLWFTPQEKKIKYWYKFFKPNNPYLKFPEAYKYYNNYKGRKVGKEQYLQNLNRWESQEYAIKYKPKSKWRQYYLDNKDKAMVVYSIYAVRIVNWWSYKKALITPKTK